MACHSMTMLPDVSLWREHGVFTCQNGRRWVGIQAHMGRSQEAYDAECAALARALETAARRQTIPERLQSSPMPQAGIKRMALEEPGPGQKVQEACQEVLPAPKMDGKSAHSPNAGGARAETRRRSTSSKTGPPRWKAQQKELWTKVREETGTGEGAFWDTGPPRRC